MSLPGVRVVEGHHQRELGPLEPAWERPPYRAILMKIGEELRDRYGLPAEFPQELLTLVQVVRMIKETDGKQ